MPVTLALFATSLLLAFVAITQGPRRNRRAILGLAATGRASTRRISGHQKTSVLVRVGRVGSTVLANPVRARLTIAPESAARTALCVTGSAVEAAVPVAGVMMARVWSQGLLVLEFGGMRRDYGSPWPVSPEIAGWEIHLVDACGRVFRCYGGPDSSVDDDLDRLRARIHGSGAQVQTPVVRTESMPAPLEGTLAAQVARLMARAS